MAAQFWTIVKKAKPTQVVVPVHTTSSSTIEPKDQGCQWDDSLLAVKIPAAPRSGLDAWDGTKWTEIPSVVEATLIAKVKADNEALVRSVYSMNYGKQKKYSRKQQEVLDFRDLGSSLGLGITSLVTDVVNFAPAFNAMTAAQQAKKFRFAMAEARIRGVTIAQVIAGYEAAIDSIEQKVANWEAIELKAIADIKAATTVAAKRAVYAAINWKQ